MLDRFHPAARRYLQAAVGDPDTADELFEEFARALLRSDSARAEPTTGRFRDILRTTLVRIVDDRRRIDRHDPTRPAAVDDLGQPDEAARFDAIWRELLLQRTWRHLDEFERQTGQPFHTTLRCRTNTPGLSSAEMAEVIGSRLGRDVSVASVRQLLHRARAEFSRMLLDEVIATLPSGAPFEAIERELIETGLLAFCREAIDRIRPAPGRRR